jgi:hypothetical protein
MTGPLPVTKLALQEPETFKIQPLALQYSKLKNRTSFKQDKISKQNKRNKINLSCQNVLFK